MFSIFTKDKRGLAEKRETLLDVYLFNLLRQPERVGWIKDDLEVLILLSLERVIEVNLCPFR